LNLADMARELRQEQKLLRCELDSSTPTHYPLPRQIDLKISDPQYLGLPGRSTPPDRFQPLKEPRECGWLHQMIMSSEVNRSVLSSRHRKVAFAGSRLLADIFVPSWRPFDGEDK
jgi:hypothetical protein